MHNVSNIWHVPIIMAAQGAHEILLQSLKIEPRKPLDIRDFRGLATKWDTLELEVRIAMVGKYTELSDAYLSVVKALQHASMAVSRKLKIHWIEAADLEHETGQVSQTCRSVPIPSSSPPPSPSSYTKKNLYIHLS